MIIGYLSRLAGLICREQVNKFNSIVFKVFFPTMIFNSVYKTDLMISVNPRFVVFVVIGIVFETAVALLIAKYSTLDRSRRGVMVQGMMRANTVVVGLPIAMELLGDVDISPVVICLAIAVPLFNIISVVVLESYNGEKVHFRIILLNILKNPLIIGTAAALLCTALKIKLPSAIMSTIKNMGQAASPIMLFLVGAFFTFDRFGSAKRELVLTSVFRLLIFPALILFVGMSIGFRDAEFVGLITIFASSTAVASFSMAQQLGGDGDLAGNIVVVTNALCPITFFIWSYIFKTLGCF